MRDSRLRLRNFPYHQIMRIILPRELWTENAADVRNVESESILPGITPPWFEGAKC